MAEPQLKRNITFFETVAIVIGLVIGSGIFLKPAAVLINSGSSGAAILAWLASGLFLLQEESPGRVQSVEFQSLHDPKSLQGRNSSSSSPAYPPNPRDSVVFLSSAR